jgi:diguanylate cyclase (GGDEF) domain
MNTVVCGRETFKTRIKDTVENGGNWHIIAAPLVYDNQTGGVIVVANKSVQFSETDMTNLNLFASQAALAINNTRLYEEALRLAQTDSLTGLYNHKHFFELAKKEISRALRYQHPLTVLMVDIDYFKDINDTYGHSAGDQVLISIANLCRKIFRNIDILARYGGEEFAILLPETPVETALEVAERLRHTVENLSVSYHRRQFSVTISVGLTSLRDDCSSIARLIDRADTALYHSKSEGRNRITLWKASMCYMGSLKHPNIFFRR